MEETFEEKNELLSPKRADNISYKKTFLFLSYFSVIPFFIVFLVLFSLTLKYQGDGFVARQDHKPQYQALPDNTELSAINLESHDSRKDSLKEFLASYNSPLEEYAGKIIEEADKHEIDYRLLPAIAMQESTLCKKIIKDSHNCWGFGIYGGKVTKFNNYNHAIEVITKTISEKYVQKGFVTPEEIVTKYTPSDTGKWPEVVNMVMTRLKASI